MGSQYREYCCCCIPTRFVVFILSFIWLLSSIAVAGFSWFVLSQGTEKIGSIDLDKLHNSNFNVVLDSTQRTVLYVLAGVYTAAVIISLLGVIGALARKRRLVQTFFYMLLLQLLISIGAGAYYLYLLFKANACTEFAKNSGNNNSGVDVDNFVDLCNQSIKSLRISSCISFAISWLFQIWMLHAINEYVTQLRNENAYESVSGGGAVHVPLMKPAYGDEAFHYSETPYDPYGNKQHANSQYAFSTPYTANTHNHA
jgi:hypothetical protein